MDTWRFRATLWGLRDTYDVHLGLIGKGVVDFLLVLIELFLLGVMAVAFFHRIPQIFRPIISQWLKIDLKCP